MVVDSEEGPWIQKVPDALPKLIAPASAAELKSIASEWAQFIYGSDENEDDNKLILDYL